MHNRIADRVSPERIARIESYRTAPRIPQETRFTFDAFERDPNYEVQQPKQRSPKLEEAAVVVVTAAFLIAAVLIVKIWVGIN